jgi:two-component system NarL family response regulator
MVAQGCQNKEIAETLSISLRKAEKLVSDLLIRLDAKNRAHAVTIAVRKGIISFEKENNDTTRSH